MTVVRFDSELKKPPREEAGEKKTGRTGCRKDAGSDRKAGKKHGTGERNQNGKHNSDKEDGNWQNDGRQRKREAFA